MATNEATFSLNLETTPGAATQMADALEGLRRKIEGDESALRSLQSAMRRLQQGSSVDIATYRKLQERITAKKQAVSEATAEFLKLGGSFQKVKKPTAEATSELTALKNAASEMPGPLGSLMGRLGSMQKLLAGGAIAAGVAAIAAALTALAAAAGVAVVALARYGIAQADARRSDLLRLEGLSKHRNLWQEMLGMGRRADSGGFLDSVVSDVTAKVPLLRAQVTGLTEELYRAGLRGQRLKDGVEGAAFALAGGGEAAASQFKAMAQSAHLFGGSVRKLADDVQSRYGGVVAAQLLSLSVQFAKLKENIHGLFRGLKIEALLGAVKAVTDLFSQASASGRALKTLIEGLLQPIIDWLGTHGQTFKNFFRGMIIAVQFLAIWVLDLRDKLRETFGDRRIAEGIDTTRLALWLGIGAVSALVGVIGALGLAVAVAFTPFIAAAGAVYALYTAIRVTWEFLSRLEWSSVGTNIIDGIVGGITAGIEKVKGAITSLASVMSEVFSRRLQIRSPSRLFRMKGREIPRGSELGIRDGIPRVEAASEDMAEATVKGGSGAGTSVGTATAAPAAPITITFGNIVLEGAGGNRPQDFADELMAKIEAKFEGIAITMGALRPA